MASTKSKLTLWVDSRAKKIGKEWARRHQESLSQVVTDYLIRLEEGPGASATVTPLVKKLTGVLSKTKLGRGDYRKYLEKKYLGS